MKLSANALSPTSGTADPFSFPSGHATLSVVVYGFLAFLVSLRASHVSRVFMASGVVLLVAAIAFSRLYLGVHWMSDVVAGLSFGMAWVAVLAIAYLYRCDEMPRSGSLAAAALVTFALAATVHLVTHHATDLLRYAPVPLKMSEHPVAAMFGLRRSIAE